ncbi:hypothetical protein LTR56_014083 [Elasticomyces elasticus]|nr:hypothetical protein LTR22_019999 [Elasticomyces elasticus]KAK3636610.1 hypothetical protein LTR56_014083 [Elasticomyces elasticus]KAK4910918.1 hypothetical protein LTR49_020444 [Elasticomyces elasticus]KAK5760003.1 hypothetical protein LTS12_009899 [Elasticomyces elasticus]
MASLIPKTAPSQLSLFRPASSTISPWRCITGAQEWQTSTYHYNKQTLKTLPTASHTADKLLRDFSTAIASRGLASTGSSSTARSAMASRRKSWERVYMSETSVKDYGDRVVVKVGMFDAKEAEAEERRRKFVEMQEKRKAMRAKGGRRRPAGAGGAGGSRRPGGAAGGYGARPPMRTGAGAGGGFGARPPMRTGGPGGGARFGARPPMARTGGGSGGGFAPRAAAPPRSGSAGGVTGFESGIRTLKGLGSSS